ncbi:MAG: NAD(P)-binding domain-containing protein [Myxococcales bacterium]|nr:NAD(P)-binding domain-containing protein [Myxococcales bacterium]
MKVAVLGTGDVGKMLGTKLLEQGHEVRMGSRSAAHEGANAWAAASERASVGTFADAAAWSELAMLAVSGQHALAVAEAAREGLRSKVLIDLTNPLDFSGGFPPTLSICNDDSLGEQLQRALSDTHVVKTLNTLANPLMLDPGALQGPHDLLMCGNDAAAKQTVAAFLQDFGWSAPIDLGDIDNARGLEMWLVLWTRLYRALGTGHFNLHIQRGD